MYESLGNQLLADANGFGKEIAERILVEKSWPSQAQVTVAHDIVEGNNTCHLVKARLSSGEPILRIQDSENKIWEARLQDGWLFRGILEGKKVQTREAKTFLKKLNAKHSTAFVKMVEHCMVDLIEAHQSKVKPIHETERFGPYHLPMTEAFMGYDLPVSEGDIRDRYDDDEMDTPDLARLILKQKLEPIVKKAAKKTGSKIPISFNPNKLNKDGSVNAVVHAASNFKLEVYPSGKITGEGSLIRDLLGELVADLDEPRRTGFKGVASKYRYKVIESEELTLNEGTSPLERKMLRNSKDGHHINKGVAFNVLRKKGLLDDSGVLTQAGELEIAESADLSEGKLTKRDIKFGAVLVNKNTGKETKVSGLKKASHVRGGYSVSLASKDREDNLDIAQVLKSYDLKESKLFEKKNMGAKYKVLRINKRTIEVNGRQGKQEFSYDFRNAPGDLGAGDYIYGTVKGDDLVDIRNESELSEFKAPVEIPFGAIVDYQGREYKKLQLTDKPIWRQEKLADKRQKELGTDIVKGDKNYDQIEKRAKMQLRSKKLFDPKKLPTDIKTKYRILVVKMLKAPTAMKRKFQDEIDALLKKHLNPGFSPMTDSVTEAAEKDIWTVSVRLVWQGFVIFAGGQEGTTDNETTLTFNFANEEDAKEAASVANGFHATADVRIEQDKGTGYPAFKRDLFLKILDNTVDPKIHKTIKAYKRGRFRKRRY